jgi:hypothetical protein
VLDVGVRDCRHRRDNNNGDRGYPEQYQTALGMHTPGYGGGDVLIDHPCRLCEISDSVVLPTIA